MRGGRQKWVAGRAGWRLHWVDGHDGVFKVEQEGDALADDVMREWGGWMDAQFAKYFGRSEWPALTASTLNLSRNELGDEGVRCVVEYLRRREIAVQVVKLFKNNIGDVGAWAIGQLLAHAREPVQEVHLSHNRITEQGACSIFEAIARSGRYPYQMERSGRRESVGLKPVWLRMEYNCIQWSSIEHRLDQQQVRWCAAESRDGWGPKDQSPMVCMHSSYRNQSVESFSGADAGAAILAQVTSHPSDSVGGAPDPSPDELADEGGAEEVPMYVFLDASAVRRFAAENSEERLFTFQGLLNLCQQGHMKCTPPEDVSPPSWLGSVEERDRIILVVTDAVLDELADFGEHTVKEQGQLEWLRNAPDSYLQQCFQWGILEVVETKLHTQLIKLAGWEPRAHELGISRWTLQNFDFACLWESQIEASGRVLFVTADAALVDFAAEAAAAAREVRRVATVHVHALDRAFADDREHSGNHIWKAAQRSKANKFCGAILCAQIMHALVVGPSLWSQVGDEALREGLREAVQLLSDLRPLLRGAAAASAVGRIDDAQRRWQTILRART